MRCLTKLYILQRKSNNMILQLQMTISLKMEHIFKNLNCTNNGQVCMHYFCSKNTIPSKHKHIQPFPVKLDKMLIKATLSVPFIKAKSSMISSKLFRPFLFSSRLDYTTCPDLLLVIKYARKLSFLAAICKTSTGGRE